MRRWLLILAALVVAVCMPASADAYVREVTISGRPIAWKHPCVEMRIFVGAPPSVLTADECAEIARVAAAAWSSPQLACTAVRLTIAPDAAPSAEVGYDGHNVIVFRQGAWCRKLSALGDATNTDPGCYPASALAVTSIVKNSKTGEVLDADIEINAVNYRWADLAANPSLADGATADFQYALTHELGHVIGLDHNCYAPLDGQPRLVDSTGAPEVDCYGLPAPPPEVTFATMYPSVDLTDTSRRLLSQDDQQGACDIYPAESDFCPGVLHGGGCNLEPPLDPRAGSVALGLGVASVLAAFVLARQRRR